MSQEVLTISIKDYLEEDVERLRALRLKRKASTVDNGINEEYKNTDAYA